MTELRDDGIFDTQEFGDYLFKHLVKAGLVPDEDTIALICEITSDYLDIIGATLLEDEE